MLAQVSMKTFASHRVFVKNSQDRSPVISILPRELDTHTKAFLLRNKMKQINIIKKHRAFALFSSPAIRIVWLINSEVRLTFALGACVLGIKDNRGIICVVWEGTSV